MITMTRPYLALGRAMRLATTSRGTSIAARPFSVLRQIPRRHLAPVSLANRVPARLFSSTSISSRPSGTVDEELFAKLQHEINVETELGEHEQIPENLKEFLETSQFKLNDKDGMEEVELIRRFGDETVRVIFSIADLNAIDEKLDDPSLYDQEDLPETGELEASAKRGASTETRPTDEDEPEYEEASEPAYPARLNITIEKSTSGALQVEAIAQDGMIIVENVHYHPSVELATAQTAEADWERRGRYVGPPFGNLDEDLQVLLERYLDERGINTALALFVPDYIDYKEQKEYVSWLKNVKSFVQA
ncbi:hypothetical protein TWF788_008443 [Orbilia oligospora]|uniref:Mitochondrial acidic protein mam33 n=2 Tax=Orbilia oligospora TaxID=2813651 RepID=A0A6G1LXI1_ORBOL|nr:hypothetical protein TWF788_008443 [Orbilia oligospora]KAF3236443.1 hypothetical protein TWF192_011415 [Orbilia oligospora]